jgi:ArsR family transcriptional regulator
MPAELELTAPVATPRVAVSAVSELTYALFAITKAGVAGHVPDHWSMTWLRDMTARSGALVGRVAHFWDDGYPEWSELLIFAQRSGTLFDEQLGRFLGEVSREAPRSYTVPELPTEPPDVPAVLGARLQRLRESVDLCGDYTALLREVWAALQPTWGREGLPAARRLAASLRERLPERDDFRPLLPGHHFALREQFAGLVETAAARGELVLVPLALAGRGIAFFGLPGVLLVGFGPEASRNKADLRQHAQRAAARFKVLSDPTRVAILLLLSECGYTVTDIARLFELSQPTVSVHMKALREAGLLEARRAGAQTLYHSSPARVREYLGQAGALLEGLEPERAEDAS